MTNLKTESKKLYHCSFSGDILEFHILDREPNGSLIIQAKDRLVGRIDATCFDPNQQYSISRLAAMEVTLEYLETILDQYNNKSEVVNYHSRERYITFAMGIRRLITAEKK